MTLLLTTQNTRSVLNSKVSKFNILIFFHTYFVPLQSIDLRVFRIMPKMQNPDDNNNDKFIHSHY